ncbi:mechanosensitive ion channel family protein [Arcanobacterium hippocoleae]
MQFLFKTGAEKFFAFTAGVLTSVESKAKIFTAAGATEAAGAGGAAWAEPAAGAEGAATEAVETTFDLLQLILSIGLGVGAGVIVGLVIVAVCRFAGKHHPYLKPFFEACARPLTALCLVLGATIGFRTLESVKDAANPGWFATVEHLFLILLIAAGTWLVVGAVNGAVELIHNRMLESSERRAARVRTQTQILHRVIVVVIWVLGFAGILLTFPSARAAGASLLASAGLVSVVAGLAAQTTLGNVFAGLQLAFSDSIRVGDIVHYKGNYTTVEEITLTYVVLAVWDGRRIIVPSSLMTTEPFENWTRRKPDMIGEVTWEVDWSLPIEAARKEFMHLLNNTDLWDGKTGVLSINDATANALILRAVVSAEDSATLTDLKYYLREKMVLWIQREAQQAIPHQRYGEYPPVNIAESQQITNGILEERLQREQPVVFMPKGSQDRGGVFSEKDSTAVITLTELKKLGVVSEDSAAAKSALRDNGKSPQNQDQDDTQKFRRCRCGTG